MSDDFTLVVGIAALIAGSVLGLVGFYMDRGKIRFLLLALGIAGFIAGKVLLQQLAGS